MGIHIQLIPFLVLGLQSLSWTKPWCGDPLGEIIVTLFLCLIKVTNIIIVEYDLGSTNP